MGNNKSELHPCYSESACTNARMHLPVAPQCNISCNYCNRKYDCLHETRPGVTSEVLTPEQAFEKYKLVKEKIDNLTVIGIAGPGDALANFDEVRETINLIKEDDPDMIFCLSTNGLNLPEYAQELIDLDVSHVTITINTIDPRIGANIYKFVNYKNHFYFGEEAAELLLKNQLEGLKYLSDRGVTCKVNVVMIKGLNDEHIPTVVNRVKENGAFMTNIMPLIPAEGSAFADRPLVSNKELNKLRNSCSDMLKQMYHCQQCRADAIGTLTQDRSAEFRGCGSELGESIEKVNDELKSELKMKTDLNVDGSQNDNYINFAVTSESGKVIDKHFGHVDKFLIYRYSSNGVQFLEERDVEKYCDGVECEDKESKTDKIISLLDDCKAVLTVRIGHKPKNSLAEAGIKSLEMYEYIEKGILKAAGDLNLNIENTTLLG
ncbi:MAG: nitrogenase cofactor biosynthesis protein NifB [Bacillota bacterium]